MPGLSWSPSTLGWCPGTAASSRTLWTSSPCGSACCEEGIVTVRSLLRTPGWSSITVSSSTKTRQRWGRPDTPWGDSSRAAGPSFTTKKASNGTSWLGTQELMECSRKLLIYGLPSPVWGRSSSLPPVLPLEALDWFHSTVTESGIMIWIIYFSMGWSHCSWLNV